MSFAVKLQYNKSPVNQVTKKLTDVAIATGTLKTGTSIIDPIIEVRSQLTASIIKGINYAYIERFGRYYYITDIVSTYDQLWEIHMHVDVLMSFNSDIRSQNAIVSRQATNFNMMLDDGWFMAYQDPIVEICNLSETAPFGAQEYVLVLAGNNSTPVT